MDARAKPGGPIGRGRPSRSASLLVLMLLAPACGPARDDLVVATDRSAAERARIGRALAEAARPVRVRWIRVGPGEDPTRAADRRPVVDAILGGPAWSYEKLAARGRLRPIDGRGGVPWKAIRRDTATPSLLDASPGRWREEYARLVLSPDEPAPVPTVEGFGLVAGSTRREGAAALAAAIGAADPPTGSMLVGDLLDAVLVDSSAELRAARAALASRDDARRARALLTEPPPWPPASVLRMLARPDGPALVRVLAEQVAPDPLARSWLTASFDEPPRTIDGAFLDTLQRAAGGRLAAEPRFRSWIRSEWTAWARQRYRRVARNLSAPKGQAP